MARDDATLLQVCEAARLARSFVAGMDQETFAQDARARSAVLYQLLVIGEAAKRLSEELKATRSTIPWKAVAGMRDRLIHGYDVIDVDQVWHTVQEDLPTLLDVLEPLVPPANAP